MLKTRALTLLTALAATLALTSPALAEAPVASIIGGSTVPAAPPYAAFIQATVPDPGGGTDVYSCTGSLIASQYILTAAHCAFDQFGTPIPASAYRVRIGVSDWATAIPAHTVAVTVYPAFNPDTLQGDVAVLTLTTPVANAVIPLATTADAALYAAGQPATVMGWGLTANDSTTVSPTLQSGSVAVQANSTCNAAAAGISFRPGYDLCAAAPGFVPAACHGDSGGPLVVSAASGPVQIGIVSYGTSGTCAQGPDFYTRASSIQAWAASVVAGAPAPPPFVPSFAAPVPVLALNADGVVATFTDAPDPATLLTGFIATLYNGGVAVASQPLLPTATSASFPGLLPASYTVAIVADYTEGVSAAAATTAVTLAPPANTVRPSVTGKGIVGTTLHCLPGTWAWPGSATLTVLWLRSGLTTGVATPTYRVRAADAGKKLACQVLLHASTGPTATATSMTVHALSKLAVRGRPQLAGRHVAGAKLTCSSGTWAHTGSLKLSYAWLRDGKALTGAAAHRAKRAIKASDAGHRLSCRVKAKTSGQSASATSATVRATA